jgi:dTDP-4-dehydrorhamnose reductase
VALAGPVAIIGAAGQLGTDLQRAMSDRSLVPLTHADLDIRDADAVRRMLDDVRPSAVINTSAYHRVDECEDHPDLAFEVNAIAVRRLAEACGAGGATLVHFSTDYVFSGERSTPWREDDAPLPPNVYAASKLAGEHLVRSAMRRHFVVRTCGLYGAAGSAGKGGNFVETMLRMAREGKSISVVSDQTAAPTATADLAEKVRELLETEAYGLYHLTNAGECTWFRFAQEIFTLAGLSPELSPTTSAAFGARAPRPTYSVLDNAALRDTGIIPMRPWPEALAAYLKERGHVR